MTKQKPMLQPAGDQAIAINLSDTISPETNRRVHDLATAIEHSRLAAIVDLVPSYSSLLLYYDPLQTKFDDMAEAVLEIERSLDDLPTEPARTVLIPTLYGGDYGPDLKSVAKHIGLTEAETIQAHAGTDYLVYMLGFSPGFPYLGGLSDNLATPRLETPRTRIPGGSVGIAENQTGIYPVSSPGGWRLVGRTPLRLFDASNQPPSLLKAGDFVRFVPISNETDFLEIDELVNARKYEVLCEPRQ